MEKAIKAALARAWAMNDFIYDQLKGKYDNVLRFDVFARFLSLAECHHRAILILVGEQHARTSAFALWRSILEACYRGLFVGFCATDRQVESITKGGEPYPAPFACFAKVLDVTFRTDELFSKYAGELWIALNDFTHGGLQQLNSRMTSDGKIGENVNGEKVLDLITESTSLLTDTAIRFLAGMGRNEAATSVTAKHAELYPVRRQ